MPEKPDPCPFRYIYKGRTFCALAILNRKYTTNEVIPRACKSCDARGIFEGIGCRHLNLGVEVDRYGGAHEVDVFYASCERLVERLLDFEGCGEGVCPHWEPVNADVIEAMKAEALGEQKQREADHTE
mgnify:CR=1 FL=1